MKIDDKFIMENGLVAQESSFLKNYNNFYITDEQVTILKNHGIDISKYKNVNELIMTIESYLNNTNDILEDLEWVSQMLSEYNYYNNTNK